MGILVALLYLLLFIGLPCLCVILAIVFYTKKHNNKDQSHMNAQNYDYYGKDTETNNLDK